MTYADLLDQITAATGDDSGPQRTNARRWLNLTRSVIADMYSWPSAIDPAASFNAGAKSTTGLYSIGSSYENVVGDLMYDQTNNDVIMSEQLAIAKGHDVDRSTTGPPEVWSDAGLTSAGNRQVYLWPRPDASYTIQFIGRKRLQSISASDDAASVDAYFGDIQTWSAAFEAGMRYYSLDTDNEDGIQVAGKWRAFLGLVRQRKSMTGAAYRGTFPLGQVKGYQATWLGRLDPAHFDNNV